LAIDQEPNSFILSISFIKNWQKSASMEDEIYLGDGEENVYSEGTREANLEDGSISAEEEAFMKGYDEADDEEEKDDEKDEDSKEEE